MIVYVMEDHGITKKLKISFLIVLPVYKPNFIAIIPHRAVLNMDMLLVGHMFKIQCIQGLNCLLEFRLQSTLLTFKALLKCVDLFFFSFFSVIVFP